MEQLPYQVIRWRGAEKLQEEAATVCSHIEEKNALQNQKR